MTAHALRQEVGDEDFFRILRAWTRNKAGGNATIPQFIRLAERVSGEQLDDLFQTWLYTGSKPEVEVLVATKKSGASAQAKDALRQLTADRPLLR